MTEQSTRNQFYSMFLDRLRELRSGEQQILMSYPTFFDSISSSELKLTLEEDLKKTGEHLDRLDQICKSLDESPKGLHSESMDGLLKECEYLKQKGLPEIVKEAALISSFQKILHYQIAGYGSVRTFSKHLGFKEIYLALKQILDEKYSINVRLIEIAEGDYYTKGINVEAAQ